MSDVLISNRNSPVNLTRPAGDVAERQTVPLHDRAASLIPPERAASQPSTAATASQARLEGHQLVQRSRLTGEEGGDGPSNPHGIAPRRDAPAPPAADEEGPAAAHLAQPGFKAMVQDAARDARKALGKLGTAIETGARTAVQPATKLNGPYGKVETVVTAEETVAGAPGMFSAGVKRVADATGVLPAKGLGDAVGGLDDVSTLISSANVASDALSTKKARDDNPDPDLKGLKAERDFRAKKGDLLARIAPTTKDGALGIPAWIEKVAGLATTIATPIADAASAVPIAGGVLNLARGGFARARAKRGVTRALNAQGPLMNPPAKRSEGISNQRAAAAMAGLYRLNTEGRISDKTCALLLNRPMRDVESFVRKFDSLVACEGRHPNSGLVARFNDLLHFDGKTRVAESIKLGRNTPVHTPQQRNFIRQEMLDAFIHEMPEDFDHNMVDEVTNREIVDFGPMIDARSLAEGHKPKRNRQAVDIEWRGVLDKVPPEITAEKQAREELARTAPELAKAKVPAYIGPLSKDNKNIRKALAALPDPEMKAFIQKYAGLNQTDRKRMEELFHFSSTGAKKLFTKSDSTAGSTPLNRFMARKALAHHFVQGMSMDDLEVMKKGYNKGTLPPNTTTVTQATRPTAILADHIRAAQDQYIDGQQATLRTEKGRMYVGAANVVASVVATPFTPIIAVGKTVVGALQTTVGTAWGAIGTDSQARGLVKPLGAQQAPDIMRSDAKVMAMPNTRAYIDAYIMEQRAAGNAATPEEAIAHAEAVVAEHNAPLAQRAAASAALQDLLFAHDKLVGIDKLGKFIPGPTGAPTWSATAHKTATDLLRECNEAGNAHAAANRFFALRQMVDDLNSSDPGKRSETKTFLRDQCQYTEWEIEDLSAMDKDAACKSLEGDLFGESFRRRSSNAEVVKDGFKDIQRRLDVAQQVATEGYRGDPVLNEPLGWRLPLEKAGIEVISNNASPGVDSLITSLAQAFTKGTDVSSPATQKKIGELSQHFRGHAFDQLADANGGRPSADQDALLQRVVTHTALAFGVTTPDVRFHYQGAGSNPRPVPEGANRKDRHAVVLHYDPQTNRTFILQAQGKKAPVELEKPQRNNPAAPAPALRDRLGPPAKTTAEPVPLDEDQTAVRVNLWNQRMTDNKAQQRFERMQGPAPARRAPPEPDPVPLMQQALRARRA